MEHVRYRIRVSRLGCRASRLTHLGQIEMLRRAVMHSGLPAATDRRRRPRPRLAFGPAIALGYESLAEYFDLELTKGLPAREVASALSEVLDCGFALRAVRRIPRFYPSLDASINVVRYEICGPFPRGSAAELERFLARKEIVIQKIKEGGARVEHIDARPLIREMVLSAPDCLRLTLRFGPKRTLKPEALLKEWLGTAALGGFRVLRKDLLSETSEGELLTP